MSSINDKNSTYQNGVAVRKQVMGEAHVERSMGQVTPFNEPLQDWINEHAWGSTWQRGGIDKKNTFVGDDGVFDCSKKPNRAQRSYSRSGE